MHVTRIENTPEHDSPSHFAMSALKLQGWEVSDCQAFGVVVSYFLPGGGIRRETSPVEKVYVMLEGEVVVVTDNGEESLRALDSCHIPAGEARAIENRTKRPASMLAILPYPGGPK